MAIPVEEVCLLPETLVADSVTAEETLPNNTDDVIKFCEDFEAAVPLSTAVNEIATPTDEVCSLDKTDTEVEEPLPKFADEVNKFEDRVEDEVTLPENVNGNITPSEDVC